MKPNRKAFVLMPFAEPYNAHYGSIFKPALEGVGYDVSRADDLFAPRPIVEDIATSIKNADLILCEMSGKNPNVFYELGLAHSLGKPVILVSQSMEDIPFDLRHIRVLLYACADVDWADKLRKKIAAAAREMDSCPDKVWPPPLLTQSSSVLHRNVRVLHGRRATVELLGELVSRAGAGDLVFGSCNTCSDYPPPFYKELPRAISRGACILFVAQDKPDSAGFIDQITTLKRISPDKVRILKSQGVYLRLFGIRDKEVIMALPLEDEFIGLYFGEPRVAAFLKLAFDEIVAKSEDIP